VILASSLSPTVAATRRRGFSLTEMVTASFLMTVLAMLLVMAWKAFGVPAVEVEARARLAVAANLAAASFAQDMGGYQVKLEGKTGPGDSVLVYRLYKFDSWQPSDDTHPYPMRLRFKPENPASNLTTLTIGYYVDLNASTLVRLEEETGTLTTVATHVTKLQVAPVNQVSFTVSYWRYQGTYGFSAINPQ
jgi:prepilin-type N-terminal cleavage/methylation domain-containing protein